GHDDRHAAELADALDDLPAVEARQRDVEHHEVGMPVVEAAQRLGAAARDDGRVTGLRDPAFEEGRELRLVLDDQDGLVHAGGLASTGSVKLTRVPRLASGRSPTQ